MADAKDAQGAVLQGEQDAIVAGESGQTHLQSRTFDYSSLGRLVSATNPEKDSATTYTYDRNGNLLTRVDGGVAYNREILEGLWV